MRTEEVFTDGLILNMQIAVEILWGREQDAHLLKIVQYADMLLEQTRQVLSTVMASFQRNCFQRGHRTTPVVDAEAEQRFGFVRNSCYVIQSQREKSLPKKGSYDNDYRIQSVTHCHVCLAKVRPVETRPYTVSALGSLLKKWKLITSKQIAPDLGEQPSRNL